VSAALEVARAAAQARFDALDPLVHQVLLGLQLERKIECLRSQVAREERAASGRLVVRPEGALAPQPAQAALPGVTPGGST
jgi:hypothetical protein